MSKKTLKLLALLICVIGGLYGCDHGSKMSNKTIDGLDKLGTVKVVSREEGSGTRTTFVDLVGLGNMTNSKDNSDNTTKNSIVKKNAAQVMQYVEQNKDAIGYVSVGDAVKNDKVKILKVEGRKASKESISKGKYNLSRSFYLTYTGELKDVERDFISYVEGKGQETISRNYVAVAKSSRFLSDKSSGKITIHGSTSMTGVVKALADDYMKLNKNATIKVIASDSSKGLQDTMNGTCDIGMSSRELKDYEKELLNYETIGKDGIAIVVNKTNPVDDISIEQLEDLYSGNMKKWNDLNKNK